MKQTFNFSGKNLLLGLLMTMALFCPRSLMADEQKWSLTAHSSDGSTAIFEMEQVGSLVAVDDAYDFTILDNYGNVLAERILKVTFSHGGDSESGIKSVKQPGNVISAVVKDNLTLMGVSGTVTVYDATGALKLQAKADGDETVLNVTHLTAGVYLVKVGKQTFKFIKQ